MNIDSKRRWPVWGISIFVVGCIVVCTLIFYTTEQQCQADYMCLGDRFLAAMRVNDVARAKALVVQAEWRQIDAWQSKHKPQPCDNFFSMDYEIEGGNGSGSPWYENPQVGDQASFSGEHHCSGFQFHVSEVIFEKQSAGWKILRWGEICESNQFTDWRCY